MFLGSKHMGESEDRGPNLFDEKLRFSHGLDLVLGPFFVRCYSVEQNCKILKFCIYTVGVASEGPNCAFWSRLEFIL